MPVDAEMQALGARALRRKMWVYRCRYLAVLVAVPTILTLWPLEVARSWRHDEDVVLKGPTQTVTVDSVRDSSRRGVCTRVRFTTADGYRHSICGTEDVGDSISVVTDGTRVIRTDDRDGLGITVAGGSFAALLAALFIALYGAGRGMPPSTAIRSAARRRTAVLTAELDAIWERDSSLRGWRRWWRRGKKYEFYRLRLHAEDGGVILWSGRLRTVLDEATGRRFPCALWWETLVLVGDIEHGGWAWLAGAEAEDPRDRQSWRAPALDLQPPIRPLEVTTHEEWRGPYVRAEPPEVHQEPRDAMWASRKILTFMWRYRAR